MNQINVAAVEAGTSRPLVFTGSGASYFRIWAINWLLTLATLGIYSSWAKVRRLKYFHQNITLADASFDYHGDPVSILKGRAIGLLAFLLVSLVPFALLPFMLVLPLLLRSSMRFRLHNTSYRGLRFSFIGTPRGAYFVFLLGWLLSVLSMGLLAPYFHRKMKEYQHNNACYGSERFAFSASTRAFYALYAKTLLLTLAVMAVFGVVAGALSADSLESLKQLSGTPEEIARSGQAEKLGLLIIAGVIALNVALMALIGPFYQSRSQNLIWGSTVLDRHFIRSNLRARGLAWIHASNAVLVLFSLGLFMPWASVRLMRYRVESLSLESHASLDSFLAGRQAEAGAIGQETAEWFDIDIGL